MTFPRRPYRTSQAEPPRTKVQTVASIDRPGGWNLHVAILTRPGSPPSIGLRTANPASPCESSR